MQFYTQSNLLLRNLLSGLFLSALGVCSLDAQSLSMVSGNGQVSQEQFLSNAPMVVQAKDASGRPAAGVAVNWSITQGAGTLNFPSHTTDANGLASTIFLSTNIPGGLSVYASTVTASTVSGSVSFIITTALTRASDGSNAAPPLVQLLTPTLSDLNVTAPSGSTLRGGVLVKVIARAGPATGQPVPNVGVRIVNNQDPTTAAPAACNGPNGLVLTDSSGMGTCDLVVSGPPGTAFLSAYVGEYQYTTPFNLHITQGVSCTFSLSPPSQAVTSSGGNGSVNVLTSAGCGWTASSNASWITITSGASGTGNGTVTYTASANVGDARSGTVSIAGQTYTVNQGSSTGASPLTIATPTTLPGGTVNTSYFTSLSATGGKTPYNWSIVGALPSGLNLTPSTGGIAGTPTTAGVYPFTATVTDGVGAAQSQSFSITISGSSSSSFSITTTSFPSGSVGQAYQQGLATSGGCVTPFSPPATYSITGGSLPNGLSLTKVISGATVIGGTPTTGGNYGFTLTATDPCGNKTSAGSSITISGPAGAAQMTVSSTSLAFTVQSGIVSIPADQTVTIGASSGVLNYIATPSGANWLVAKSPFYGNTPGSITVGVANFAALAPGSYNASISIASQASNGPVAIQVSLTVLAAPVVVVSPGSFAANLIASSTFTTLRQTIVVGSNTSGVRFTASATTTTGNWLSVTPTEGAAPSFVTATIDAGRLAPGMYTGTIVITPAGGAPQPVTITLNVLSPPALASTPPSISFIYQPGSAVPSPQTVTLTGTVPSLSFSAGTFTQSGGNWLSVDQLNGLTPANLNVSANPVNLSPGTYNGTITVSSLDVTVAPIAVNVTLTVLQPVSTLSAITNAASFTPGPVAPGEYVTLFGTAIGPTDLTPLRFLAGGTLDTTLAATRVLFDGIAAPLIYVWSGQVTAIVPYELTGHPSSAVQVEYKGLRSNTLNVQLTDSAPGIFLADTSGQGAIINEDSTVNSVQHGADPGSIVSIYATGEGQTDPQGVDGQLPGLPLPKPLLDVSAKINGQPADVSYAGAAPGLAAGLLQVNAKVPLGVPRGTAVSVVITIGNASSQPGVTLFIRP